MDVISYTMAKKYSNMVALGLASATVDDVNKSITFTLAADGSQHTIHFSQPSDGQDGISVTGISDKGNGIFTLLFSDGSESDPIQCVKGEDGFSPTATVEKVGKIATITITDKNGTTTATIKDGEGSEGGEANVIDSISVNGVNVSPDENKNVDITVPSIDGLAKTEDIPTNVSELTNDSGYLTEHQDISGKVDKVDGKSLIADTEIARLATVDNYDDTQVKTQIQAVANGLMDSVGYSADYKSIDIIAKNGVKKSVNVAPIISHASITELSDVDTTNKATGKALVYNATTSKHEYADVSGTDEKVKMDASTDAKYLGELLDNVTIANENGELKVKKLDGQEVTITEINYLKGLTMNIMDLVNMFSNGGVKIINTPVATYAELLTLDKSSFIEGISYLVYVLTDENHDNAKTTYLVDKDSETPTYFGFADSQRDFTTNPIDLATEITGKLGISNMDSDAIKALFTVDDTYKTETATNNAFSTHGAKALYDELLLAIGNKANDSDLTAHKDDADIHVSTEDRTKWDSAKAHADSAHAPSNAQENVLESVKVNNQEITPDENKAVNIDLSDYAKTADIPTTLPANGGNSDTVNNHTVKSDVPENAEFTDTVYDDAEVKGSIEELNSNLDTLEFGEVAGGENFIDNGKLIQGTINPEGNVVILPIRVCTNFIPIESGKQYSISVNESIRNYAFYDVNKGFISITSDYATMKEATFTAPSNAKYIRISTCKYNAVNTNILPSEIRIMLAEGSVATPYEPYIPSVKMLAEKNVHQSNEIMDIKMLGWSVPSECPIQNYTDSDGVFHQKVGRVDLGSLTWTLYIEERCIFRSTSLANIKTPENSAIVPNLYVKDYTTVSGATTWTNKMISMNSSSTLIFICDTNYTTVEAFKNAMKGVYLYYELATPITKTIDGNEAISKVNESLSVIGKCKNLLKPTLKTTEKNGVTCTDNGDGTYTLNTPNGAATAKTQFIVYDKETTKYVGKKIIICGCPAGGDLSTYNISFTGWTPQQYFDTGNGYMIEFPSDVIGLRFNINIGEGVTVNNLVFKPMLVDAEKFPDITYDDFVPYTGEGDTLTHDVAELKNDLSDYGMDNKFDGVWEQGYPDESHEIINSQTSIHIKNTIPCTGGEVLNMLYDKSKNLRIAFYDASNQIIGNIASTNISNELKAVAPSGTSYIDAWVSHDVPTTPSTSGKLRIYVGNEIDQIKNDLDNKNCGYIDFSINWNNVTKTGLYNYNGFGGTDGGSNRPTDTKCIGVLMVANTDNATMVSQTFISKDMKVYIRIYSGGAWGSWTTTS